MIMPQRPIAANNIADNNHSIATNNNDRSHSLPGLGLIWIPLHTLLTSIKSDIRLE